MPEERLPTWSFSALKTFEQCPYRSYLQKIKKIPEPQHPAAKRGTDIHNQAEDYVKGEIKFPATLGKFTSSFKDLYELYADAKVELEGDWGFTKDWAITGWRDPDVWARIKLDAIVRNDETSARVIDYKTGRKWGNEITHGQQALLYAIASFIRYPELEFIRTELWYLDHASTAEQTYTRGQAMLFFPRWEERAHAMTNATEFPPKPSIAACKWCSYRTSGDCDYGVEK
jgi:CRISPR/Cas system-associated exonuclease Cas4 (RecB family)